MLNVNKGNANTLMKTLIYLIIAISIIRIELIHAEELLKTSTSWDGGKIRYPEGKIEIISVKLKLEEGQVSKYHCHPVPTFGYILKGNVEVETKDGKKVLLKEGESSVEVMKTIHRGKAVGGPVEIIVFYAGAKDVPNMVLPESEAGKVYCN